MSLRPEFAKAEDYALKNNTEAPKYAKEDAYLAGWIASREELSKSAGEFNAKSVANYAIVDKGETIANKWDFLEGARYQHSQDQLIIQSLRLRIAEIEGEK